MRSNDRGEYQHDRAALDQVLTVLQDISK